jgi:hypothetical protein
MFFFRIAKEGKETPSYVNRTQIAQLSKKQTTGYQKINYTNLNS